MTARGRVVAEAAAQEQASREHPSFALPPPGPGLAAIGLRVRDPSPASSDGSAAEEQFSPRFEDRSPCR